MKFSTRTVIIGICGLLALNCFCDLRAQPDLPVQTTEEKAFADLTETEPEKVTDAVNYLIEQKTPAAKVVPRVLPLLKIKTNDHNENSVLALLAYLIGSFGPDGKAAVPQLIEIIDKISQIGVREGIKMALVKIDPDDERVFAVLRRTMLAPRSPGDAVTSAEALAKMGPIALRAIPDLNYQIHELEKTRAAQYADVSAAHRVYYALGEIAAKNTPLPPLDEAMKTLQNIEQIAPDKSILAFMSLQKSGKSAAPAIPILLSIIARGEEFSAGAAMDTLGFIGSSADLRATQTLLEIFERGYNQNYPTPLSVRAQAALMKSMPQDTAGVPALVDALKSPNRRVRITAAQALANIGSASASAAANFSDALRLMDKNTDHDEWTQYIRLIKVIGKDEGGLVDAILEVLDSPKILGDNSYSDRHRRANLWIALADILNKAGAQIEATKRRAIAARVVRTLQSSLQGERENFLLFVGATRAARALGENAKDAVPILMEAIQSDKWSGFPIWESDDMIFRSYLASTSVRLEAIRALGQIGKPAAPALPTLKTVAGANEKQEFWGSSPLNPSEAAREAIRQINAATENTHF